MLPVTTGTRTGGGAIAAGASVVPVATAMPMAAAAAIKPKAEMMIIRLFTNASSFADQQPVGDPI